MCKSNMGTVRSSIAGSFGTMYDEMFDETIRTRLGIKGYAFVYMAGGRWYIEFLIAKLYQLNLITWLESKANSKSQVANQLSVQSGEYH